MHSMLEQIYDIGIIPVVTFHHVEEALPLCRALKEGGLLAVEVTFRTDCAQECIRTIHENMPEMLLGAGTVLTTEQADSAIAAGASFIVSPGFHSEVAKYVMDQGVLMIPGTATPGEMEQALSLGLDTVKFFPAEQNGGVEKLKAIAGPYRNLSWMCTGGITADNMSSYLDFDRIIAVGGSWMCKRELIEAGDWETISKLCREAVRIVIGLGLSQVTLTPTDLEYIGSQGSFFDTLPDVSVEPSDSRSITFCCSNLRRARYHLTNSGVHFKDGGAFFGEDEKQVLYIEGEILDFTMRICKK